MEGNDSPVNFTEKFLTQWTCYCLIDDHKWKASNKNWDEDIRLEKSLY